MKKLAVFLLLCLTLTSCNRKIVFKNINKEDSAISKESKNFIVANSNKIPEDTASVSASSVTTVNHIKNKENSITSVDEFNNKKISSISSKNDIKKSPDKIGAGNINLGEKGKKSLKITGQTRISEITSNLDNAFNNLIFPKGEDVPLRNVRKLLKWENYVNEQDTIAVVNYIIKNEKSIFYNIYTDEEKEKDESLKNTGLFFFRGKKKAKTAIICPGGDFTYLSSIHDGFPQALELSKRGYNVFVLIYRFDRKFAAMDLARTVAYLHKNKNKLKINLKNYSIWGSSSGGKLAIWLGNYGTEPLGEKKYPKPAAIITQYTDWYDVKKERPTFASVGTADGIADPIRIEKRINKIKEKGIMAEFYKYRGIAHGFGLVRNYMAHAWFGNAIRFWEKVAK